MITAEEFERQYAERSNITVAELRELGRVVRPCHCGEDGCQGWQAISRERAEELDANAEHDPVSCPICNPPEDPETEHDPVSCPICNPPTPDNSY